jgi:hypothetical protein
MLQDSGSGILASAIWPGAMPSRLLLKAVAMRPLAAHLVSAFFTLAHHFPGDSSGYH